MIASTGTSGNLVHHAYHLWRFQTATGLDVPSFTDVVEIGGGYGSMARVLHRLTGGRARTCLYDLPEFSALQRYFLGQVEIPALTVQSADGVPAPAGPRLLVATWSLSEMDLSDRDDLLARLGPFDGYLLAYQDDFCGTQNRVYFDGLVERTAADVDWVLHEQIDHIPGNRYLFGKARVR